MKRETFVVIGVILLFLLVAFVFFNTFSYSGFATGNASFGFQNLAPVWSTIPNQSWAKNTQISLNLSNYSSDPENYNLTYGYTIPANITVNLSRTNLTLIPDNGFAGNRTITFSAYDYVNLVYSNAVFLTINSSTNVSSDTVSSSSGSSSSSNKDSTSFLDSNESEEERIYLSPELSVSCKKEYLFLDDLSEENYLDLVFSCNTFYLGYQEDISEHLANLYFVLINKNEGLVIFDYTDNEGVINQVVLSKGQNVSLDIDGNGLFEYFIRLESINNDDSIKLYVEKLPWISFALFAPLILEGLELWQIIVLILILITLFCFIFYLYSRKLFK